MAHLSWLCSYCTYPAWSADTSLSCWPGSTALALSHPPTLSGYLGDVAGSTPRAPSCLPSLQRGRGDRKSLGTLRDKRRFNATWLTAGGGSRMLDVYMDSWNSRKQELPSREARIKMILLVLITDWSLRFHSDWQWTFHAVSRTTLIGWKIRSHAWPCVLVADHS